MLPFYVLQALPLHAAAWRAILLVYCLVLRVLNLLGDDDFVRIFLGGVSVDMLRSAGHRVAVMMSRKAHEPVLRQLFALQRAGAKIVVVTANARPLVEPFIVDVLRFSLPPGAATELALDAEGRVRRDSPVQGGWNVDGSKQKLVETHIAEHGISFSIAYGDQASDVPTLLAVDEATVVNPKKELHLEADRRHWQIVTCRPSEMHLETSQHEALRVAIIGGGWAGLYVLKHCLQQGLDAILLEKTDACGGLWNYRHGGGGVFANTIATASRGYMQASDFPFNDNLPEFLGHKDYRLYLQQYVAEFGLGAHIRLNSLVTAHMVEETADGKQRHRLTIESTLSQDNKSTIDEKDAQKDPRDDAESLREETCPSQLTFDRVIVATGREVPVIPPLYGGFTGTTLHSSMYTEVDQRYRGKAVLIAGGGESASHIAEEICTVSRTCVWSIRTGVWFQDRHAGMLAPADMRFGRMARMLMGNQVDRFGGLFNPGVNGLQGFGWGPGGSGVAAWQPIEGNVMKSWANKDRNFLWHLSTGRLKPKRAVVSVSGSMVEFDDGESLSFDVIILCTGFKAKFPPREPPLEKHTWYKHVFSCEDPSTARVGFIRPTIGSVPAMTEMQARWVAAVFAGEKRLPAEAAMRAAASADVARRAVQFPHHHDKMPTLENFWNYTEEMHELLGCRPTVLRVVMRRGLKGLKMWIKATPNTFESLLLNADDALSGWAFGELERQRVIYKKAKSGLSVHKTDEVGHGASRMVFASAILPLLFKLLLLSWALMLCSLMLRPSRTASATEEPVILHYCNSDNVRESISPVFR